MSLVIVTLLNQSSFMSYSYDISYNYYYSVGLDLAPNVACRWGLDLRGPYIKSYVALTMDAAIGALVGYF